MSSDAPACRVPTQLTLNGPSGLFPAQWPSVEGKRVRRLPTRTRLLGADGCAPLPTLSDSAADPRKVARGQCAMSSAAAGDFAHLRQFHMTGTRSSILLKLQNGRGGP